ncbi:MAG: nuclear transport factor 2 family protein [Candidatus Binatia bacterium]
MDDLHELEAIKRLEAKYFRCCDLHLFDELQDCFTADVTAHYHSGQYTFEGRAQSMRFLREAFAPAILTSHHGHAPEIELTSRTTAVGIWAMQDICIDVAAGTNLRGAGFCRDAFVKIDGHWKIRMISDDRIYAEIENRADSPSLRLTDNFVTRVLGHGNRRAATVPAA